jgi:hypothetical protein
MHTLLHGVNIKLDSTPDKVGHHPTHKMCQIGWRVFYEGKGEPLLEIKFIEQDLKDCDTFVFAPGHGYFANVPFCCFA